MPASDTQMQTYANERLRVRAEQFRALINACRDDKAAIDAVYDRAANGAAWVDSRNDGPPKLLASQDFLVFNAFISNFINIITGSENGTETEINNQRAALIGDLRGNLAVFQSACVRPV